MRWPGWIVPGVVLGLSSNLPIVEVYALKRKIPDEPKIPAHMTIFYSPSGGRVNFESPKNFSGRVGIEIRGQSSQNFPKKQYGIELWDSSNNDIATSLLDMPAESDWILQGPYSDKSLIRNWLAYQVSNTIGRYAVRSKFVEVLKSEPKRARLSWWQRLFEAALGRRMFWPWRTYDYIGLYLLMERIKRDPNRVAIIALNPWDTAEPAVSGGYILKIDKLDVGDDYFQTKIGRVTMIYEYPRDIVAAQKIWIKDYIDAFEETLNGPSFDDPVTGYTKYIDVDSFVDFFILQELFRNVDGFRISTFMHKERGGKLAMGPVWDFDISMGNANYYDGWMMEGWLLGSIPSGDGYQQPFWWRRLLQDPSFANKVVNRWTQLRQAALATNNLLSAIDATGALLQEAQARNFARWPILGTCVWPNPPPCPASNVGEPQDHAGEVQRLKAWLQARLVWMDANISSL